MIIRYSFQLASYFVLPIMIAENIGPAKAFKHSIKIIRNGWKTLFSVNVIVFPIFLGILLVIKLLFVFYPQMLISYEFPITLIIIGIILFLMLVAKTIRTIFDCGLYLMIAGKAMQGLDINCIKALVQVKNKKI